MKAVKAAWVEVSGDALACNPGLIRSRLRKGTRICAVIKGSACGHGLTGIERILTKRGLADVICMDHLCIDVTDSEDVAVGDTAVFPGEPGVTDTGIVHGNKCSTYMRTGCA